MRLYKFWNFSWGVFLDVLYQEYVYVDNKFWMFSMKEIERYQDLEIERYQDLEGYWQK